MALAGTSSLSGDGDDGERAKLTMMRTNLKRQQQQLDEYDDCCSMARLTKPTMLSTMPTTRSCQLHCHRLSRTLDD